VTSLQVQARRWPGPTDRFRDPPWSRNPGHHTPDSCSATPRAAVG